MDRIFLLGVKKPSPDGVYQEEDLDELFLFYINAPSEADSRIV